MSSTMALFPATETLASEEGALNSHQQQSISASTSDVSVPYVDKHYGSADGIIDPTEYAVNYTDPATGITAYLEHNGTALFIGLDAATSGWIGIAWQNYTDSFSVAGLNNSDLIYGYAPGTPYDDFWRAEGTDLVTVHYILSLRNGTVIQENDYPSLDSTETLDKLGALQMYKDMIYGMRIGEVRHFVIPADQAYNEPGHDLYGEDLVYDIELTRIVRDEATRLQNPADHSEVVYSDHYGVSTLQHLEDGNQSRVLSANATDNSVVTSIEYILLMNSTDTHDIPLLADVDESYPFLFMYSTTEDINDIPVAQTYWANPIMIDFIPNEGPEIISHNPVQDSVLGWAETFQVEAIDTYVRLVQYRLNDEDWVDMTWNFQTGFWEVQMDLTDYENGPHVVSFNATDPSNATSVIELNVTLFRPYIPFLGVEISVEREVLTELYHRTFISDIYTIRNNGSIPISTMELYLPVEYEANLLTVYSISGTNLDLKVVDLPTTNGMLHWRIHFSEQVGHDESYLFSTVFQMHSLNVLADVTNKVYELTFLKFPVLPYVISEVTSKFSFRGGEIPVGAETPPVNAVNVAPMTIEEFSTRFNSDQPNIVAERKTTIRADAWGWLLYKETITLYNEGENAEVNLIFSFPTYSDRIRIYDGVGILAESQNAIQGDWNTSRYVDVDLSADRFGEDGLQPGFQYTFNMEYVVKLASHEKPAPGGMLLTVPMGEIDEMLVVSHTVDLVLPISFNTVEASEGYRLLYGAFDTNFRYQGYNVSEYNPLRITVLYQVSFAVGVRPIAFSMIIAIFALAYIAYRLVELPESVSVDEDDEYVAGEKRQVGAPPELLRDFANLYAKKTALAMDLEKLEAARRRGKVKKREFMIREKDLKTQLEDIDSKLPNIKNELATYGSRYRDMVGQLELQNEKIEGAKAGLRQLLLRKKKQRISRVAFEKTRQDYLKTIQKATSSIDRTLLSIQEEAGDI
jgi:FKBP-type peptidyl-prolyl cis-trans isomerase 2